ncbi:MAG: hypothetical protein JXR78_02695 [Victivallales bacterium]|nr:hypothetical protein [Victivallales bacterium]
MKKFLIAVFALAIGSSAFAQNFIARVDVQGVNNLELKPAENGNMTNATWGNNEKRKFIVTGMRRHLPADKWTKVTFSFIPVRDGRVSLNLLGQWFKERDKKNPDQMWIYFSSASLNGAELVNGDLSDAKDGVPVGWRCAKDQYITDGLDFPSASKAAVKVWHNQRCTQEIAVKGEQTITITAYVRPAEYIPATE